MNIEAMLEESLWSSVRNSYENRDYQGAIIDAMFYLFDLIREKSGLETDGTALVGEALGGKLPKLRINKLQTESEKDAQRGIEQIVRGMCQAIRNPRSHGKVNDSEKDAVGIIVFIDYLVRVVGQSKTPFTKVEFIKRVFDPAFVERERYAELMVREIPSRLRPEIMFDVFRSRETGDSKKLMYFTKALFAKLTKAEKAEVVKMVSDELGRADTDNSIAVILNMFPVDMLKRCSETTRLRIENMIIASFQEGSYSRKDKKFMRGGLGTFARSRADNFIMKKDLIRVITKKIGSENIAEQDYVFEYIWETLPKLRNEAPAGLRVTIKSGLKKGNKGLYDALCVMRDVGNSAWVKPFEEDMDKFVPADGWLEIEDGDLPF
jgi:uncharacterized protein (TIGR02391 family)